MSEKLRESLSAVMDGEADELELRRTLNELDRDEDLRGRWVRYHEARAVMRGEHHPGSDEMADRVWQALTGDESAPAEPTPVVAEPASGEGPRMGRITGFAVAAAMAMAVIVGSNFYSTGTDVPGDTLAEAADSIDGKIEGPVLQITASGEVSAQDLQRARAYMLHHVQHKAMNQPGVSSFAKMVTFEEERRSSDKGRNDTNRRKDSDSE